MNTNLYIPNASEIENVGNTPDNDNTHNNCNSNMYCPNIYNQNNTMNYLYNSCGTFSVLLPKVILQLVSSFNVLNFIDGSKLTLGIDNQSINYDTVINVSNKFLLTTALNSRILTTNCQKLSVCLNVCGQINVQPISSNSSGSIPSVTSIDNSVIQLQTYVFNGNIELPPIMNIDKCVPPIKQAYLPSVNNNAIMIINYTYIEKTFTVNEIGILLSGADITEAEFVQYQG